MEVSSSELSDHELFSNINHDDLDKLLPLSKEQTYETDETIIEEGTSGQGLFYIVEGKAHVLKNNPRQPIPDIYVTSLDKGDCFGGMSTFTDIPCTASVISRTEISVLFFPDEQLYDFLDDHPSIERAFLKNFISQITQNLRATTNSLTQIKAMEEHIEREEVLDLLGDLDKLDLI